MPHTPPTPPNPHRHHHIHSRSDSTTRLRSSSSSISLTAALGIPSATTSSSSPRNEAAAAFQSPPSTVPMPAYNNPYTPAHPTPLSHTSLPPLSRTYNSPQTSSAARLTSPILPRLTSPVQAREKAPFSIGPSSPSQSLPRRLATGTPPIRLAALTVIFFAAAFYMFSPSSSHHPHTPAPISIDLAAGEQWGDSSRPQAAEGDGYSEAVENESRHWWNRPFGNIPWRSWPNSEGEEVENESEMMESDEELRPDAFEDEFLAGGTSPDVVADSSSSSSPRPLQTRPLGGSQNSPIPRPDPRLPPPFLSITCAPRPCSALSATFGTPGRLEPTCAKYVEGSAGSVGEGALGDAYPAMLRKSVLHPSTGDDIRRILMRAARRSSASTAVQRARRKRQLSSGDQTGTESTLASALDDGGDGGFRVMVLGGSVSNCRGVDRENECWHALLGKWFKKVFPIEGDDETGANEVEGKAKRGLALDLDYIQPGEVNEMLRRAQDQAQNDSGKLVRRSPQDEGPNRLPVETPSSSSSSSSDSDSSSSSTSPYRPLHQVINLSKSATSSAYFSHCLYAEIRSRGKYKALPWGPRGPDLIVLEFGVNDIIPEPVPGISPPLLPSGGTRTNVIRDFDRLITALQAIPSRPAIIALEAASKLLENLRTGRETGGRLGGSGVEPGSGWESAPAFRHLPGAVAHDVPIISAYNALFLNSSNTSPSSTQQPFSSSAAVLGIDADLWLPDGHHPNVRGHEIMSDVVTAWLEERACEMQESVRAKVAARGGDKVEWERDLVEEGMGSVLSSSEADSTSSNSNSVEGPGSGIGVAELQSLGVCRPVGEARPNTKPKKTRGWRRYATTRDKKYLMATKPGSTVTFSVTIPPNGRGEIRLDWLRSRFYNLGDVLVYLDGRRREGVKAAGWWSLRWSVGMPTVMFEGVKEGKHDVTVELLGSRESSHPEGGTEFRIIALVAS